MDLEIIKIIKFIGSLLDVLEVGTTHIRHLAIDNLNPLPIPKVESTNQELLDIDSLATN